MKFTENKTNLRELLFGTVESGLLSVKPIYGNFNLVVWSLECGLILLKDPLPKKCASKKETSEGSKDVNDN